jgi:ATPase family associated with various cellular activities (AAA)
VKSQYDAANELRLYGRALAGKKMEATPLTHNPIEAGLILTKLGESIQQAGSQYFRLVVLAGPPRSGKTTTLQSISQKLGCGVVNVNLELSKRMLELTRTQRPRQVERLLKEVIAAVPGQVALLDNLEILFDAGLQVEPLRLLQVSSRNRIIVASWSGSYRDSTLTYAEPGHPEFAQFKQVEAIVISIGTPAAD